MDLFDFTPASRKKLRPGTAADEDSERVESVTQVTRRIRDLLESGIGSLWVRGEVSNHRKQSSGHHYFTIRDAGAQLACVLFRSSAAEASAALADGHEVRVFGEVSVYEARGQYQMIVKQVRAAGLGALQVRFEALKKKLLEEGLFEGGRKKPIPRFPRTVAIVTSPTGAALQDMLNILKRRAPWLRVLVFPVRVQGAGAAEEIAAALRLIGTEPESLPRIDTVVIARGGGSLEDLWAFNEEAVARAVADCPLPVISAVGHEIDFSIADFAADLRAPTPSAAAELLAPDRAELLASLAQNGLRLQRRLDQTMAHYRRVLELMSRGVLTKDTEHLLSPWRQRVDDAEEELSDAAAQAVRSHRERLQEWSVRLERHRPDRVVAERQAALTLMAERLQTRVQAALTLRRAAMERRRDQLGALGPDAVLSRGFSCTLDKNGRAVRDARQLQPGDEFTTRLARGKVRGVVRGIEIEAGAETEAG
ncbi:MAG: exodeoxyribonuclease VII large subunit [Verrucomicrobiota bacterium]